MAPYLERGARLRNLPLDQRFIRRLEASLELPISVALGEISRRYHLDAEFTARLRAWMVEEQGWELSEEPAVVRANLIRAARLSCYTILNRLVFYEVLRRRFRTLPALAGM